jgi:hypothetical protein
VAYTFTQLTGRVNDIPHRPKNQDLAEVQALVNESYAYVVAELGTLQKTAVKTLTNADGDYNLISDFALADFAAIRALFYTAANGLSTYQALSPISISELIGFRQGNPSATSPAVAYAVAGWGNISLQPLPATGDTLTIFYTAYPAVLVAASDTPVALPTHLQHLIVGHAAAVAMEQVDINYAMRMHEQFQQNELARARRWLNNHVSSQPFTPGANARGVSYPSDAW